MRIALYSRKSITTDKGESIQNQLNMCKNYINNTNDNCIFEEFIDEGYSGKNINRPAFKLMMDKARNNKIDAIVVYKIDRISRNTVDFVNLFSELEELNVKLISVTEGFDPSTPIGKMMFVFLSSLAEVERMNISQRVKDNMMELAKSGKWSGGICPTGYIIDKKIENDKKVSYLKIDEGSIGIIKIIHEKYIEFESIHKVQKYLFEEMNLKYCMSTIKNILSSPIYVKSDNKVMEWLVSKGYEFYGEINGNGIMTYNRRPYVNSKKRLSNNAAMFCAVGKHEGIIESYSWLKIQYLLERNVQAPRPKESKLSCFTKFLKCAKCNSSMTLNYNHTNKDGIRNYYYVCVGKRSFGAKYCSNKWAKQDLLDDAVLEQLKQITYSKKEFNKIMNKNKSETNYNKEIDKIKKEIKQNNEKIDNLVDKICLLNNAAAEKLTVKINQLSTTNIDLQTKLSIIQNKSIVNETKKIDSDYMYDTIKDFSTNYYNRSVEENRKILSTFLDYLKWDSDTEFIDLKLL